MERKKGPLANLRHEIEPHRKISSLVMIMKEKKTELIGENKRDNNIRYIKLHISPFKGQNDVETYVKWGEK